MAGVQKFLFLHGWSAKIPFLHGWSAKIPFLHAGVQKFLFCTGVLHPLGKRKK
jgi:hypothetical protein